MIVALKPVLSHINSPISQFMYIGLLCIPDHQLHNRQHAKSQGALLYLTLGYFGILAVPGKGNYDHNRPILSDKASCSEGLRDARIEQEILKVGLVR